MARFKIESVGNMDKTVIELVEELEADRQKPLSVQGEG